MIHEIVKDFHGSQDGRFTEHFKAGEKIDLSDYLVACVNPDWVRLPVAIGNKAIVLDGNQTGTLKIQRKMEK